MSQTDDSDPSSAPDGTDDDSGDATTDTITQAVSTSTSKVIGETGATDATGVLGRATSGTSVTYGVRGETQSTADGATAVHGQATTDSGVQHGVRGAVENTEGFGVVGTATTDSESVPTFSGYPIGVYGVTDRNGDASTNQSVAILGWNKGTSGDCRGVWGRNDSPDGYAIYGMDVGGGYGVYSDGDAKIEGNQEVTGARSTGAAGMMAYLGSQLTCSQNSDTTVVFDSVKREDSAIGSYDTSTGEYTFDSDGDYVVEWQIDWSNTGDSFNDDRVDYKLLVNGSTTSPGFFTDVTENGSAMQNFHKPLWNVSSGDTIKIVVNQQSDTDIDIEGYSNYHDTFFSVRKFA